MNKKHLINVLYVTAIIFITGYAITVFSQSPVVAILTTIVAIVLILLLIKKLFNS